MNRRELSIVLPYKNAAPFIKDCVESIQNQEFENWELLAVNDHSTDDSREIIGLKANTDDRITLLENNGDGIIDALQSGWNRCSGMYITRMDADDLMPDGRLNLMIDRLKSSSPGTVVSGKVQYFNDRSISPGYLKYQEWLNDRVTYSDHWKWVMRECVVASPNWVMRKEDLQKVGAFESLMYPEDYHLVLNWFNACYTIEAIDEVTLLWREHPSRTSRNSSHYNQEHFFRLKLNFFLDELSKNSSLVLWGDGVKGKLTASILKERKVKFRWMVHNSAKALAEGHEIENLTMDFVNEPYQLLIAVYPEGNALDDLLQLLAKHNIEQGRDCWFL